MCEKKYGIDKLMKLCSWAIIQFAFSTIELKHMDTKLAFKGILRKFRKLLNCDSHFRWLEEKIVNWLKIEWINICVTWYVEIWHLFCKTHECPLEDNGEHLKRILNDLMYPDFQKACDKLQ